MKSGRGWNKDALRTAILGILTVLFFVAIILIYYRIAYEERRDKIIKDGRMAASRSADQFERYLATNSDLVKFTAYTLNEMIVAGKPDEEIQEFLVGQSSAIRNAVIENSTGLYGYINGRFFSGTNWTPPDDYDATERPWYQKPMRYPGEMTILEPYVDVQSGNTMLALGKTLCDAVSVISVDVSLNQMQRLTEEAVTDGGSDIEMILTGAGIVVTHSDPAEVGKDYSAETGTLGAKIMRHLKDSRESYFEISHDGVQYIVYDAKFEGDWHCISVHDASRAFGSLNRILIFTIVSVILIVLIIGILLTVSARRSIVAHRALAENEARSVFLANMSHEIRTPINTMMGMNEMILRETGEKQIHSYAEDVKRAGEQLLGLVDQLLYYSKNGKETAASGQDGDPSPVPEGSVPLKRFIAPEAQVLVVDDTPMNLVVFEHLLQKTRIGIDLAGSADEGLALTAVKKYDILFFDHMMPEKDGIEALHELRRQKDNPNLRTPAVCLTANAIKGARDFYLGEGFDDYLSKPIDAQMLESTLLKYLPQDKIAEPAPGEEEGAETAEEFPEELRRLGEHDWIDVDAGVRYSGTVGAYLPLLRIFLSAIDEKQQELDQYYASGDLANYAIKVHALKSSARIIGMAAFGDEAQELENAAKNGDMSFISGHHAAFLREMMNYREPISEVFAEEDDDTGKPEADPGLMTEVYEELSRAADEMDCDRLLAVFTDMKDYRIPDADADLWKKLEAAANNYDYGGVTDLLDGHGRD